MFSLVSIKFLAMRNSISLYSVYTFIVLIGDFRDPPHTWPLYYRYTLFYVIVYNHAENDKQCAGFSTTETDVYQYREQS